MTDSYSRRSYNQKIAEDADQVEHLAMIHGAAVIDSGLYDDRVSGALDPFEVDDVEVPTRWQRDDLAYDTGGGDVRVEVDRRASLLGKAYPFELAGNQLIYRRSKTRVYEFCLAISIQRDISSGQFVKMPRYFERLSALLVRLYFGAHSKHIHVGSPRDRWVGTKFSDAAKKLNALSGEWVWDPRKGLPDASTDAGDQGVDFVVWKETLDGREGALFLLAQCSCGNDWPGKFNDLNLRRVGKWFHPLAFVKPVRAFAIPHHMVDGHLLAALEEAGMIFDRVRLSLIAERNASAASLRKWHDKIAEVIALVTRIEKSIDSAMRHIAAWASLVSSNCRKSRARYYSTGTWRELRELSREPASSGDRSPSDRHAPQIREIGEHGNQLASNNGKRRRSGPLRPNPAVTAWRPEAEAAGSRPG